MEAEDVFQKVLLRVEYPLYIVTTTSPAGERGGCIVGFATQCSIDPPRFLVGLSKKNHTWRVARDADVLVVHPVAEHHRDLAELFGGETGDEVDKLSMVRWHAGPGGAPVLDDMDDWFAGRVVARVDLGDHEGFVLEPVAGEAGADGKAPNLHFTQARDIEPGHEP